jgi:small subunit ribosomal protein S16
MLKIRLKKLGKKNNSFFRIVLMKSLTNRNGKSIIEFGYYNPITKELKINIELILYYLKNGAYLTKTTRYLLYNYIK